VTRIDTLVVADAGMGALGWMLGIAALLLVCAAIVLAVVTIRYVALKTRSLEEHPPRVVPGAVAVLTRSPGHQNASPVPPENPHSPPTPAVGNPRARI
jgi:hypothetical protein